MDKTTEQVENKNLEEDKKSVPNPTGKGGFGDNPENINKGGRPKNEVSITYYIRQFLAESEPGHEKSRAQELAEKIVLMAYTKENVSIIKELLDRIEGTNPIRFDDEREGVKEVLEKIYAKQRDDTSNKDAGK